MTNPLDDLVCILSECIPASNGASDAVQLEQRRHPGERCEITAYTILSFQVGYSCVNAGVQHVVERKQSVHEFSV